MKRINYLLLENDSRISMTPRRLTVTDCAIYFLLLFCAFHYTTALSRESSRARRLSRRSLEAEVINSTTINLSWTRSLNEDPRIGDEEDTQTCPVQRYLIKLKENGAGKIRTWRVEADKESVTLHGLRPSTDYFIRVVTVNCEGRGTPSRWVRVRTSKESSAYHINDFQSMIEANPPGQPVGVTTVGMSSTAVVSWSPPEGGVLVRGYVVGYGEGVPDVNWQYLEAHRRNVTIRNLKKSTQYVISLRAFNNAGKGPVVYDLVFTKDSKEEQLDLSPTPTNLQSRILSPSTVWLQWLDPSLEKHQTITDNRYYSVNYRVLPDGRNMSVVVRDLHVALYHLEPATRYEFKVRLVKDSQPGKYSEPIVNTTLETAPSSPPRQVKIEVLIDDPSKALVTWKPPRQANGNITEYMILYTWAEEWLAEPDRWQSMTVPGHSKEATLSNINRSESYYFRLQARNSHGYGPKSDTVRLDTGRRTSIAAEAYDPRIQENVASSKVPRRKVSENGSTDDEFDADVDAGRSTGDMSRGSVNSRNTFIQTNSEVTVRRTGASGQDSLDDEHSREIGKTKREPNIDRSTDRRYLLAETFLHPNHADEISYQDFLASSKTKATKYPHSREINSTDLADTADIISTNEMGKGPIVQDGINVPGKGNDGNRIKESLIDDSGNIKPIVEFRSIVKIRASAFITWPRYPEVTSCFGNSSSNDVISYKLRYQVLGGREAFDLNTERDREYVVINLTQNVILLDDLQLGTSCKYQVKYISGQSFQETEWSQEETLNIV